MGLAFIIVVVIKPLYLQVVNVVISCFWKFSEDERDKRGEGGFQICDKSEHRGGLDIRKDCERYLWKAFLRIIINCTVSYNYDIPININSAWTDQWSPHWSSDNLYYYYFRTETSIFTTICHLIATWLGYEANNIWVKTHEKREEKQQKRK